MCVCLQIVAPCTHFQWSSILLKTFASIAGKRCSTTSGYFCKTEQLCFDHYSWNTSRSLGFCVVCSFVLWSTLGLHHIARFVTEQVNKHSIILIHDTSTEINPYLILTIFWFISFCNYLTMKARRTVTSCTFRTARYKPTSTPSFLWHFFTYPSVLFTSLLNVTWPHLTMQKAALVSVLLSIWIMMNSATWTIVRISSQSEHDSMWTKCYTFVRVAQLKKITPELFPILRSTHFWLMKIN